MGSLLGGQGGKKYGGASTKRKKRPIEVTAGDQGKVGDVHTPKSRQRTTPGKGNRIQKRKYGGSPPTRNHDERNLGSQDQAGRFKGNCLDGGTGVIRKKKKKKLRHELEKKEEPENPGSTSNKRKTLSH